MKQTYLAQLPRSIFLAFAVLMAAPALANQEANGQESEKANQEQAIALTPFYTDGCSSFPDGTLQQRQLWRQCCVAHDRAYWLGGSYQQRMQADFELEQCVKKQAEPTLATVMLAGVRAGGSPFWLTSYRWGYGWPYWGGWLPRGYQTLTEAEMHYADQLYSRQLKSGQIEAAE